MSLLTNRPALRWAVPAGVLAAALTAGAAGSVLSANAAPALPERSAQQLLVDLQNSQVENFSGTVVQTADLGLPEINLGHGDSKLSSLVSGTHTLRVWYGGVDKARFALLGTLGESDVIRNGNDLWLWSSTENKATHYRLTTGTTPEKKLPVTPPGSKNPLPTTPKDAADQLLKAVDPTTKVTTGKTAKVAGRDAYELVLAPKDARSRVDQIRLAIDAKEHVPLRVQAYAKGNGKPALEIKFEQISFAKPEESQFSFVAPRGTKVTEGKLPGVTAHKPQTNAAHSEPTVIGTGWTSVLVLRGNELPLGAADRGRHNVDMLGSLPKVNGAWGSGRLLKSALFSALLTDDGRVLVGAVSPEQLYKAAADPAAKLAK